MSRTTTIIAGLAAVAAMSCWPRAASETTPAERAGDPPGMTVHVTSHNSSALLLFMDAGAGDERIGDIRGFGGTAFAIPWRALTGAKRIRLAASDGHGGPLIPSGWVEVRPGGKVRWTLEPNLIFSSVSAD